MAEGLLGEVLGEEHERQASAKAAPEALVAAVAANTESGNPEVVAETVALFREQRHLLQAQRRSVEAEHEYSKREWWPRLFALRLRAAFMVFMALVATVLGLGVAVMIRDAFASHRVVIDSFELSPSLAAQALDGRIVAAAIYDRLTQLQAATRTMQQKREISDAWSKEIEIAIPETGLSVGELERILRARFGHDQHISGSLLATDAAGLALTVRGTGMLPTTFSGGTSELDALLTRAAEYLYGESQPALFVHYLANDSARYGEAIAFAKSHFSKASTDDKPYLLNYWANSLSVDGTVGASRQAIALYQEAVRIKPDYWNGYNNLAATLSQLGEEERAFQAVLQMKKVAGARPGEPADLSAYDSWQNDFQAARESSLAEIAEMGGVSHIGYAATVLALAESDARLHEAGTAQLRLATGAWNPKNPWDAQEAAVVRALIAEESGEYSAAAQAWDEYSAAIASNPKSAFSNPSVMCWAAPTYERTAQFAKADAALAAPVKTIGISTYLDCYRSRGDVLDLRGDWAGAQAWYAKAVQLASSLPSGYYSWGLALAKRGDLAGAAAKLQLANQRGPHWADPLKAWGDVLMKQGNIKVALTKYDEALKYAPNWQQLRKAREAAAKLKT